MKLKFILFSPWLLESLDILCFRVQGLSMWFYMSLGTCHESWL